MAETSTRWLGGLALLALLPVGAYLIVESKLTVLLAVLNVCLIAAALYTFLGPAESDDAHAG